MDDVDQSSIEIEEIQTKCFFFQVENAVEMGFSTTMRDHSQSAQTETPTSSHAPPGPATPAGVTTSCEFFSGNSGRSANFCVKYLHPALQGFGG